MTHGMSLLLGLGCSGLPALVGRAKKLCLTAAGGLCGGKGGVPVLHRGVGVSALAAALPACTQSLLHQC